MTAPPWQVLDQVPVECAADLTQMITGYWRTQMIYVAAELGVADLLTAGPRTSQELAEIAAVDARALHRLLRALSSIGIFSERADGCFELTPMASLLRRDVPGSLRGLAVYSGDPRQHRYRAWGDLIETVRTGKPAFARVVGDTPFGYLEKHPDLARAFDTAMASYTTECSRAILEHYDFGRFQHLVDVGAGGGHMLLEILLMYSRVRGTAFDRPEIVARASERFTSAGVAERAAAVGGDFFESVPAGGDLYLLKCVVHDWNDERAIAILSNCRRAMSGDARLLLAETVIRRNGGPGPGPLMDMNMMVVHGGQERTESELETLLRQARFDLSDVIFTGTTVDLVEATPF